MEAIIDTFPVDGTIFFVSTPVQTRELVGLLNMEVMTALSCGLGQ